MSRKPSNQQEWEAVRERAEKFASGSRTIAAIQAALAAPERLPAAMKDPKAFFTSHGVKIPSSLEVEVFDREPRTLPGPEWFPFVLEFFNCRTLWVRECDDSSPPLCRWREQGVCFGLRIFPKSFPKLG